MIFPRIATIALGAALLSGCAQPSRPSASAAATLACRKEVDRVYAAQNRVDLSRRDQTDTPFSTNYISGNTARGLGQQYGRENMVDSCLSNAAGGAPDKAPVAVNTKPGPTFSPAAR